LTYLTGYYPSPFLFRSQNAGAMLILGRDGASRLIADNLVETFADRSSVDCVVVPTWYNGTESAPMRDEVLTRTTVDILLKEEFRILGMDSAVPAAVVDAIREVRPEVRVVDVGPTIHRLMRSKEPDEIAAISRCCEVAEAGFAAAITGIKPGMTEMQAYELINNACMEAAGEPVIIYGDFASGTRTEGGGGGPTARVIQRDDLFILDCSVVIAGYRSDFANTFVVDGGDASARLREMESACLAALAAGEEALGPGVLGREVYGVVNREFQARGLDSLFPHHAGHGIGLGHPDPPYRDMVTT